MSTESGMVLVPLRNLELLYAVYHAAWHACDDSEPFEEGESPRSIIESQDLGDALEAVDKEITCPPENKHHMMEQFVASPASPPTPAVDGRTLCGWTEDADGIWESDCGESWQFTDGGPHENNCAFCHKCGKSLDIVAYVEEKETEE